MTRIPARPTLKLPVKTTPTEGGEAASKGRKPVRSGFKAPKPTVAQRAKRHETIATRSAAQKAREVAEAARAMPKPAAEKPRAPVRKPVEKPARVDTQPTTAAEESATPHLPRRNKSVRDEAPKTVYPPRGVARSTGARAFPPARTDVAPEVAREARKPNAARPPQPERAPAEQTRTPPRPAERTAPRRERSQAGNPAVEPTNERRPLKEPPRLSKRISELFGCSRREADEWIENGWVRVDGVVVKVLGTRAHPKAVIEVKEDAKSHRPESVTLILNKPEGVVAGLAEDTQKSAAQLILPENRWSEDETPLSFKATHLRGLALAGKLDTEASGMLVFTQEGSVARRIVGDDTKLEKEYLVAVEGELSAADLKKLNFGLSLDEIKLKRAEVSRQHEGTLRFVLHESRPQQIQRMCELVGLRVVGIKRLRIGSVSLGKLPAGKWRYLREGERF